MCRNNEQQTTSKGETWSRGTNSRLPFDVNVNLNLELPIFSLEKNGKEILKLRANGRSNSQNCCPTVLRVLTPNLELK